MVRALVVVTLGLLGSGVRAAEAPAVDPKDLHDREDKSTCVLWSDGTAVDRFEAFEAFDAWAEFPENPFWITVSTIATEEPARGLGLSLDKRWNDHLGLRLGYSYLAFVRESQVGSIQFEEDLAMGNTQLLFDWYPFAWHLRLSVGLAYQDSEVAVTGVPDPGLTFVLNGRAYSSAQLGNLSGSIDYPEFIPYVGLGWSHRLGPFSRWRFEADVGAVFNMEPSLALQSDSTVVGLDQDLAVAAKELEEDFADYYAVLSLGLSYAF